MPDKTIHSIDFIDVELARRQSCNQLRRLRAVSPDGPVHVNVNGRNLLNFCSNDYLGLSKHPLVRQRSIEFLESQGAGATASRLICGNYECIERLEKKLAVLKGVESSLVLASGFQANLTVIPALADRGALILSDQLNHNSLILGSRLARCEVAVYHHSDMAHLEQLLEVNRSGKCARPVIVTESVFSMDGDTCEMDILEALAEKYDALLVIDDAHAMGVMGANGMGLTCGRKADVVIGTFGKAAGSFGAYLACREKIRDYMINCCAGIVYSTALPPSVIGAIDAALELIPSMDKERESLCLNSDYLRFSLNEMGYDTGGSSTQIIPVIVGKEEAALNLSGWLEKNGILAVAIRPPTVPEGQSRIRVSLSAMHTRAHLDQLIDAMKRWRHQK
jgi:8-amino-7-oxononanoate synthase